MQKICTTSLLLIILFLTDAHALSSDWKLSSDAEGVKVWQLIANPDVTGSFEKRVVNSKIDWTKTNETEFFKKLEVSRKHMLELVGVKNWEAQNYKWSQKNGYHKLEILGSYTDASFQKITFIEVHFFYPNQTIQLLHSRPIDLKDGEALAKEILFEMRSSAGITNE